LTIYIKILNKENNMYNFNDDYYNRL